MYKQKVDVGMLNVANGFQVLALCWSFSLQCKHSKYQQKESFTVLSVDTIYCFALQETLIVTVTSINNK